MPASRMILQSLIVLGACVVGFLMGRWSGPEAAHSAPDAAWLPQRSPVWESDATGALGGSLPVTGEAEAAIPPRAAIDEGPAQVFPGAVPPGRPPRKFPDPAGVRPIQAVEPAATAEQLERLIQQELPGASDEDRTLWAEELEGQTLESAREILMLKKSLGSDSDALRDPDDHDK